MLVDSVYPTVNAQSESLEAFALELDGASAHLGADRSDLEALLALLLPLQPARSQVQRCLETAARRLATLRETLGSLSNRIDDAEIVAFLVEAGVALKIGQLSLADAEAALEKAWRWACDRSQVAESIAVIRAAQALAAATAMNLRYAAALYADAAATAGLADQDKHRYLGEQAAVLEERGREQLDIDALLAAIDLLENRLLLDLPVDSRLLDRARAECRLGTVMGVLGQRQLGTRMTENAIAAFERALGLIRRECSPVDWAAAQNGFGNALGALGQRKHDEELLEQSIAAFDAALEVLDPDKASEDWASTQNNLAAVLQTLGQMRADSKLLKRAVDAYKALLTVWTRDRLPLIWATTMNNLGTALRLLGEQRKGPRTLEQSVAAYNAALSIRRRDCLPDEWAITQNNLGAALKVLGQRTEDLLILGKAMAAFRESLKEWSQEREPMNWAMALANLGATRKQLAELNRDAKIAERALDDFHAARQVFRSASHSQLTELCVEQIALTRKLVDAIQREAIHREIIQRKANP